MKALGFLPKEVSHAVFWAVLAVLIVVSVSVGLNASLELQLLFSLFAGLLVYGLVFFWKKKKLS